MSLDISRTVFFTVGAMALGGVAYAIYFDYKRRNDAEFRRKLRKDKKRVDKVMAETKASVSASKGGGAISQDVLREALDQVKQEKDVPVNAAEREQYFMMNVSNGETLVTKGPDMHLQAALCFYRALRVYPSPVELIMIYQKTVPEPIFQIIMDLTNLDTQGKIQEYFNLFPPKSYNVAVQDQVAVSTQQNRHVLVTTKAIRAGEVIYKENPVVTALDADVREKGTHCSHCLRKIPPGYQKIKGTYTLPTVFCSDKCLTASEHANSILFSLKPAIPLQPNTTPPEDRRKAQEDYIKYLENLEKNEGEGKSSRALLAARWTARQLDEEITKLLLDLAGKSSTLHRTTDDFTDAEKPGEYTLADHLEKLRSIPVSDISQEREILATVISRCQQGFDQFITDERYATSLGKMAYNAVGVYHGEGRSDRPEPKGRPEQLERTRCPVGISGQIGSAMYTVSSYLSHSCSPNAKMTFPKNDSQIHIVALEDIPQGHEITAAYVDVAQHEDETTSQCRQRRRAELARGWKLGCACPRCTEEGQAEGKTTTAKDDSTLSVDAPQNPLTSQPSLPGGKP